MSSMQPTSPHERIVELDVIRGIAIFGILLVNMLFFSSPIIYLESANLSWWDEPWDKLARILIEIFAQGKFYPMFSFLFGLGLMLFMNRAEERGRSSVWLAFRRLVVLLVFGGIHAVFVWSGDILVTYAVLGLLLLVFRSRKPRNILVWASVFLLLPSVFGGLLTLASVWLAPLSGGENELGEQHRLYQEFMVQEVERARWSYSEGSYADTIGQRLHDLEYMYSYAFMSFPTVMAMLLFGVYAYKQGWLYTGTEQRRRRLRQLLWVSLIVGGCLQGIGMFAEQQIESFQPGWYDFVYVIGVTLGGPILTFFYMAFLVLLLEIAGWKERLRSIASVGRMALTNYFLQSVMMTLFFNGYGLGWYGKVGTAAGIGIALTLYTIQVVYSRWWMNHYLYGPVEWLWRTLTYGTRVAWRKKASSVDAQY
jgi:uncharacterized protein